MKKTPNKIKTTVKHAFAVGCILAGWMTSAEAVTIDLRAGFDKLADPANPDTINGAIYQVDATHPAGTGVLGNVFLSMQDSNTQDPLHTNDGIQEGYNASTATVMDTKRVDQFNHEIRISDLRVVVIDGAQYVPFLLDINEASSKEYITLDHVQIWTSSVLVDNATLGGLIGNTALTSRYSMDLGAQSTVLLDYNRNGSGSGTADMGLYVPWSVFDVVADTSEYVYFYSQFGGDDVSSVFTNPNDAPDTHADGGFEEWALGSGLDPDDDIITPPEPSTSMLGAIGLLLILRRRNR